MIVAATPAQTMLLVRLAPIQAETPANPPADARSARPAIGSTETAASAHTMAPAGPFHAPSGSGTVPRCRGPSTGNDHRAASQRSQPRSPSATPSSGTTRPNASPGAYSTPPSRANTAAGYDRTRRNIGTPSSEKASANTTSAESAAAGQASGSRMRVTTRRGPAATRAASSKDGSIPRRASATSDVTTGVKASASTRTTPAKLKSSREGASVPRSPRRPSG